MNHRVKQMYDCLDEKAVMAGLSPLEGWQLARDDEQRPAMEKDYAFASFNATFAFMGWIALIAERANHHPALLNRYRRASVRWISHSKGRITELDLELAAICDKMVADGGLKP